VIDVELCATSLNSASDLLNQNDERRAATRRLSTLASAVSISSAILRQIIALRPALRSLNGKTAIDLSCEVRRFDARSLRLRLPGLESARFHIE
jgi:hypothetical protein